MAATLSHGPVFDLGHVQAALADIWKSDGGPETAQDKVRACAVNFIIPIEPDTLAGWQESLFELAQRVPSRILLLERAPDGTVPGLEADVHAACHRRKQGPVVCSEIVHIRCTEEHMPGVPSLCRALAVSDLPLLMVSLVDAKLHGPAFGALMTMADIVVIDSSARDIAEEVYCDGDLTWPRLAAWRHTIASFLATCEKFRPEDVNKIELVGRRTAPRLLAGWLALLLHGRLARPGEPPPRLSFGAGRTIEFSVSPGPGGVCGVDVVKLHMGETGTIEFHASERMRLRVESRLDGQTSRHEYVARRLTFAEEVAHIVHSHGADEVYGRSRRMAMAVSAVSAHE